MDAPSACSGVRRRRFTEQYRLPFVGSAFDVFKEMNRRGKILLILDGFDEMARKVVKQTIIENFWELTRLVDENSKVILTSRNEYFRWAKEAQSIFGGEENKEKIILSPPKFEVIYIQPFDKIRIKKAIIKRMGRKNGVIIAKRVLDATNLAEMARKPVLIELLLASMDEIGNKIAEDQAQIYLYATSKLLMRNINTARTFTTTSDKLYFLFEIAWELIRSDKSRIHYTEIPKRIYDYFGDHIENPYELDTWDYDLRSQTLLHRDAAGYYKFAHKSLAEYFVALKFAAELGSINPIFSHGYTDIDNKMCKLPINARDKADLVETFGLISFDHPTMKVIKDFLMKILEDDSKKILWDIVYYTKGKNYGEVKNLGGNAITLLWLKGESFENKDLSRSVLVGADLKGCNLLQTNFKHSDLRNADLRGCKINARTLKSAKIDGATISILVLTNNYWEGRIYGDDFWFHFQSGLSGWESSWIFDDIIFLEENSKKALIFVILRIIEGFNWEYVKNMMDEYGPNIQKISFYEKEIAEIIEIVPNIDIWKHLLDISRNENFFLIEYKYKLRLRSPDGKFKYRGEKVL